MPHVKRKRKYYICMQHRAYDLCLCLFRSLKMSWTLLQSFIALRQRGGQGWVYLYPLSLLPIFWGVPHWMGGLLPYTFRWGNWLWLLFCHLRLCGE